MMAQEVYAQLARRVYFGTALQENDLPQIYLFDHRKNGNDWGDCGVSEIKDRKTAQRIKSGGWKVLSAHNDGRTVRGTHEVRMLNGIDLRDLSGGTIGRGFAW